jgi:hypothetical protein
MRTPFASTSADRSALPLTVVPSLAMGGCAGRAWHYLLSVPAGSFLFSMGGKEGAAGAPFTAYAFQASVPVLAQSESTNGRSL